jgi:ABC-type glycerol-3-phosphate transport system substrate-binding protein
MTKEQDRTLEELATEAMRSGMSRLTFMRRALALGISVPAIASALEAIEGPASARAASSSPVQINFSSWGSLDEQITVNQLLKVFQTRYPNIQVQPRYTDFTD